MARLRGAPTTQSQTTQPPSSQPTSRVLREKTNNAKSKVPTYEDDGNTDDFVKDTRPKRGQAKKAAQNEDDFVMAGGLGQREPESQEALSSQPLTSSDKVATSEQPVQPAAKGNRRPPRTTRKAVQTEAQNKVFDDMKKRMQATAKKDKSTRKPAAAAKTGPSSDRSASSSDNLPANPLREQQPANPNPDRSEFSLSPSPPPAGKSSSAKSKRSSILQPQPGSAMRGQGTPAVETSILALKNFKRRPRQPSMLQMVQQRTVSARPSAVNTQVENDPGAFDLEGDDDVEDEFAPEAEGTPLHVSRGQPKPAVSEREASNPKKAMAAPQPAVASKKRKSDESDVSSSALDALRAKRQKSNGGEQNDDPLAGFQQKRASHRSTSGRETTPPVQTTSDVQVINSSPHSTSSTPPSEVSSRDKRRRSLEREVVVPSTEREREVSPDAPFKDVEDDADDIPNGTMAEPASSSPLPSDPLQSQRTDVMAEPLTQISPRPQREKSKKKSKSKPMTTAALQSLLPKRRQPLKPRQRKSEYDVESDSESDNAVDTSHLEEDEDELGGRLRRQTSTARSKARKSTAANAKPRQSKAAPPTTRRSTAPPRKSKAPSTTKKPTRKSAKPTKTYGRSTTSDKENEDDGFESLDENDESALPDTSISMVEAAQSTELEQARLKFEEVDGWDMEFESMSVEEGRSSSQNWR